MQHLGIFKKWQSDSNTLVCLQAKNEADLLKQQTHLVKLDHPFSIFIEPDLDNQVTVIVFVAERELRKKFSSLPLAGKVKNA